MGMQRSMNVTRDASLVLVFDIGTSSLRTALFTSAGERLLDFHTVWIMDSFHTVALQCVQCPGHPVPA